MRKPVYATLFALALLVVAGGGSALAHECFNASRSENGNANATHSSKWFTLSLEMLAADVGLDEAQTEQFVEAAIAEGIPESFTIFVGNHTIGEGTPAFTTLGHQSDDKGIDHFFTTYGDQLIGILCGEVDPGNEICSGGPPE